ncbi:hypothetical protein Holit_03426 [Hollandina sp. SP2]
MAHCGAGASRQFCTTLTGTSPYSGWVEERSLLNSTNKWVAEVIEVIRVSLPFPLTGGQYDNGMEVINKPLLAWRLAKHIKASRSRPYRKNDNCFEEQKKYDAVGKTVGYFRVDTPFERDALAEDYKYLCLRYHYWYPSFRLIDKEKQGMAAIKESMRRAGRGPVSGSLSLLRCLRKARRN